MRNKHKQSHTSGEDSRQRSVKYTLISSTDCDDQESSSEPESGGRAKTYTIEEAVEKLGFGRFQLKILLVTGVMTAADAMEMLLLSVLGPALRCDWRLSSSQVAIITTVVFVGMLVGAPTWGAVSDKRGRWGVFAVSLTLIAYFGLLCSFSPNYFWLITLRGLVGVSIGGAASSFTLLSEYLPQKYRAKSLIVSNLFWGIGSTFEIVLAKLVLPTLGWRYLTAISALPLIVCLPALSQLPESARYLLASGQEGKAAAVINQMARENGKPLMKGRPAAITDTEANRGHLRSLFHPTYRRTTVILFFLWFGVAFSYYGIVLVSTEIFRFHQDCFGSASVTGSHNATETVIDASCCKGLQADDYSAMLVSSLGEFLIIPFNLLTIDSMGRRWTLSINYTLMGIFFGLIYFCVPKAVTSVLLLLTRAHAAGVFKIIYIYTTEVYPTVVRSIGLGLCSSMARFGSMSAPFVAQVVLPDVSLLLGFLSFASAGVACAVLSLLLPIETSGRALPQGFNLADCNDSSEVLSYSTNADGSQATVEIRMSGKVD